MLAQFCNEFLNRPALYRRDVAIREAFFHFDRQDLNIDTHVDLASEVARRLLVGYGVDTRQHRLDSVIDELRASLVIGQALGCVAHIQELLDRALRLILLWRLHEKCDK